MSTKKILATILATTLLALTGCGSAKPADPIQIKRNKDSTRGSEGRSSHHASDDYEAHPYDYENDFSYIHDILDEDALELEVLETGWYIEEDDPSHLSYCVIVCNPNEDLFAQFPDLEVNVLDQDGNIVADDFNMLGIILPEDTVAIVGTCKLPADAEENAAYTLDCKADCIDFTDESYFDPQCRTTDFSISDVFEEDDDAYHVTGEITNDYDDDVASVTIAMIMRKDGEIVFADKDTIYSLKWDETKSFDFRYTKEIPEHDEIEFYVTAM